MKLQCESHYTKIVLIYSLQDETEISLFSDYEADLKATTGSFKLPTDCYGVDSPGEMQHLLEKLCISARSGEIPIIQLIMHGSVENGLVIGADRMPWPALVERLRRINIQTKNNLIVISSVCFSLRMALSMTITRPAPFYMLVAPEFKKEFGEFMPQTVRLFARMFACGDIVDAFNQSLSISCYMYHCQEVLFRGLAAYLRESVFGRGGEERIERLITQIRLYRGELLAEENVSRYRQYVKNKMQETTITIIDRYTTDFLIGQPVGFDFDDLESFAREGRRLRDQGDRADERIQKLLRKAGVQTD